MFRTMSAHRHRLQPCSLLHQRARLPQAEEDEYSPPVPQPKNIVIVNHASILVAVRGLPELCAYGTQSVRGRSTKGASTVIRVSS